MGNLSGNNNLKLQKSLSYVLPSELHRVTIDRQIRHKRKILTGSFDEAPLILVCHERSRKHSGNTGDGQVRRRMSAWKIERELKVGCFVKINKPK